MYNGNYEVINLIKVIFSELNKDLGLNVIIGKKVLDTDNVKEAYKQSEVILDVLKQIKGDAVSYVLEKNGGILVGV